MVGNALHPLNKPAVIVVKSLFIGKITETKLLHPEKALLSIEVTLFGITMVGNALHPLNAYCPIALIGFLIITDVNRFICSKSRIKYSGITTTSGLLLS